MTTGEKIAEQRKKLGLTQQQFAEKLGVTRQAVSRWESDVAFPETDTLISMSELFGCSIDYLIKYNGDEGMQQSDKGEERKTDSKPFISRCVGVSNGLPYFEYKSKTILFGMPLLHVNIGLGRVAKGVFSFGLVSLGIVSFGLVSIGVLAFGVIALALASCGAFSFGLVAVGGVAIAVFIAFGGVAVGCFSFGGVAVGLFAFGGYANGSYIAIGGYAVGGITFGKTHSEGTVISVLQDTYALQKDEAFALMDDIPAFWRPLVSLCKKLAHFAMTS